MGNGLLRAGVRKSPYSTFRAQNLNFGVASAGNIDGRNYRMRDLNRGDEADICLPHDRFEVAFHETQEEFIAAPTVTTYAATYVEEETAAATLPSTASVDPLIGLLGALFDTIGGILGWARIWVRRRT